MDQDCSFWEDIERLFAEAVDLDMAGRAHFLDRQCHGRPELRTEIESLITAHLGAGAFLNGATLDDVNSPDGPPERFVGRTIGRFRLLEKIGEGGMGVVYRAERADGEFTQRVAVKLLDAPLRTLEAVRRFRAERQILATLNHPHIVTLLDGGVTDEGQAYLAMECIDGVPITRYCADDGLSLEGRLRLFRDVCGAVQDAHQHAVVHRDLKPANILVTPDGVPKILDFGIAKLLDGPPEAEATATGMLRPLTANYASPEQLRGLPVTLASDIYALGVLLYELLAGVRPYETGDKTLDQILEVVVDTDPPRPSAARAANEGGVPYELRRLKGDLDAIVLKAISKEPERRYASARELSDDIERHMAGRPVVAREPSFGYVMRTLARRHRAAFAAAAISLAALLAGLGVSLWEMRIARVERDHATARFNDVRQLAGALIFKIHDQVQPLAGSTPVRQTIVAEALTYLERLSRDPRVDDALRLELAKAYHRIGKVQGLPSEPNLGDREGALRSLRQAVDLLRPMTMRPSVPREAALEFGRANLSLATTANLSGAREAALAAARDAAAVAESQIRRNPSDTEARRLVGSALFQAALLASDPDSLPIWQRAGEVFDGLLAEQPHDPDRQRNVALVQKYIGAYYERQNDFASALQHHRRALELDETRLASAPTSRQARFDVAADLSNVGYAALNTDHLPDAATAYERSADMRTKLAESDPKDVLARSRLAYVESRLAIVYAGLGRGQSAIDHARQAVHLSESLAQLDSFHQAEFADSLEALGRSERSARHGAAACAAFQRSWDLVAALPRDNVSTSETASTLAGVLKNDLAACEPGQGTSHAGRSR